MSAKHRNLACMAVLACAAMAPTHAEELPLPRDGWVSWQVPAVGGAPAWCCFGSWKHADAEQMTCKLDEPRQSYGARNQDDTTDAVTVYARFAGGQLQRLRTLASACPVETKTPVQELTGIAPEDSARWLAAQVKRGNLDEKAEDADGRDALAALAMHRGDVAGRALSGFAHDPEVRIRKWSVFWLSMLRGNEGADVTSSVMFGDADAEVRQHAAFALSQSKSPRAAPDLIRLGNADKVGDVRSRAWFWLAQTGAVGAERAIGAALRKDADDSVREQAVFALSLLPGDRGAQALIATAEDQSLPRELRKRAVFWLSQSKADSAQAYLERVLARSSR